MTVDLRLFKDGKRYTFAFDEKGDLANDRGFDGHLAYSLMGEKRASSSEVPQASMRRGWIGNEFNEFENGSKLWLYEQERLTRTTLNGIQDAALDALQWMVDYGILDSVSVEASFVRGTISIQLQLQIPNAPSENRYFEMWSYTGA